MQRCHRNVGLTVLIAVGVVSGSAVALGGADYDFTLMAQTGPGGPCTFLELNGGSVNDTGVTAIAALVAGVAAEGVFITTDGQSCFPVATTMNGFDGAWSPSIGPNNEICFVGSTPSMPNALFLFDGVNPIPMTLVEAADVDSTVLAWPDLAHDGTVAYIGLCLAGGGCSTPQHCIRSVDAGEIQCDTTCVLTAPAVHDANSVGYLRSGDATRSIDVNGQSLVEVSTATGVLSAPDVSSSGAFAMFASDADLEPGIYIHQGGAGTLQAVDLTGEVQGVATTRPFFFGNAVAFEGVAEGIMGVYTGPSPGSRVLGDGDGLLGSIVIPGSVRLLDASSGGYILMLADLEDGRRVMVRGVALETGVCTGDVTGDSAVDVQDMVAVILSWGPCPPSKRRGATCPADIDNDGTVGVGDLIAVILNWGVCASD